MWRMDIMSDTIVEPKRATQEKTETRRQPPYNVILLNDDDHSFDYVIRMLKDIFNHSVERGFQMAKEVHAKGRVIVLTTSMERAELKQEQVHEYGPDPLIARCKGSMSAEIEPAE